MIAAWIMSPNVLSWRSPNILFNRLNKRSLIAELGVIANTTRAASAHSGNLVPYSCNSARR